MTLLLRMLHSSIFTLPPSVSKTKGMEHCMTTGKNQSDSTLLSTGIPGMDAILSGGLTRDRLYLVEGEPGTGKTTMALHFLAEGARLGESVVYITLAETAVELRDVAKSHGWTMEGIHIHEVVPSEDTLG